MGIMEFCLLAGLAVGLIGFFVSIKDIKITVSDDGETKKTEIKNDSTPAVWVTGIICGVLVWVYFYQGWQDNPYFPIYAFIIVCAISLISLLVIGFATLVYAKVKLHNQKGEN